MRNQPLKGVDGQRDQLEAEFVRELFLSGYNSEKADRLARRGNLKAIPSQTENAPTQDEPAPPHQ